MGQDVSGVGIGPCLIKLASTSYKLVKDVKADVKIPVIKRISDTHGPVKAVMGKPQPTISWVMEEATPAILALANPQSVSSGKLKIGASGDIGKDATTMSVTIVPLSTTAKIQKIYMTKAALEVTNTIDYGEGTEQNIAITAHGIYDTTADSIMEISSSTAVSSTAATLTSITPADGATSVAVTTTIELKYGKALDTGTLSTTTVVLMDGTNNTAVACVITSAAISSSDFRVYVDPVASLATSTTYYLIRTGIKDKDGNAVARDITSFVT